jgi:hypothetical protein
MKPSVGGLFAKDKNILPPLTTETESARLKNTNSYRPMDKMAITRDWVHDKYQAESPEHSWSIIAKPDYYNGSVARPAGSTDSYKPSIRGNDHRGDSRDFNSYIPSSRGVEEGGDGRYGVNKPTVYSSLHEYIVKKAFAAGISSASYYNTYYQCGQNAKEDKPFASAYWLLWRQECMIWKTFCM